MCSGFISGSSLAVTALSLWSSMANPFTQPVPFLSCLLHTLLSYIPFVCCLQQLHPISAAITQYVSKDICFLPLFFLLLFNFRNPSYITSWRNITQYKMLSPVLRKSLNSRQMISIQCIGAPDNIMLHLGIWMQVLWLYWPSLFFLVTALSIVRLQLYSFCRDDN